jgi:DNA-binding HxlR family transcriptional regulator
VADREYGDPCGVARALDRVGERWSLLVVRELLLGPKRFIDLQRALHGISPNVLTHRLNELEHHGVVRRVTVSPHRISAYELSPWGRQLDDVVAALSRWGSQAPLPELGELSPDAFVISLRTTFDPSSAAGVHLTLALRLDHDEYTIRIATQTLDDQRGFSTDSDLAVDTDIATIRSCVYQPDTIEGALKRHRLTIRHGRPDDLRRFAKCFRRPAIHPDAAHADTSTTVRSGTRRPHPTKETTP